MRIIWSVSVLPLLALLLAPLSVEVRAQTSELRCTHCKKGAPRSPLDREDLVSLSTRYGLVQYTKRGDAVYVNGLPVRESYGVDVLDNWGYFKVAQEDVLLFEGANLGSGGITGETYFLVLKPNKEPQIVQAPITPLENPIKRVWQDKGVIYVDFEVGDDDKIGSPLKFLSDNIATKKRTPAHH